MMLGLTGFGVILVNTYLYGAGLSPDAVTYISVARELTAFNGFITSDSNYLVEHPPLYPLLLAAFSMISFTDPLDIANILNAVLFSLIIYFSGILFRDFLVEKNQILIALLATTFVLVSSPLIQVSSFAWSEPLFIVLVILTFIKLRTFPESGSTKSLLLVAIIVSLACLSRYIGITLIPAVILGILL
jgi:hypothetical protein